MSERSTLITSIRPEINSIPSWKGLQSVDKRNITKLLVKDFLNIIKNKNGKRKKY